MPNGADQSHHRNPQYYYHNQPYQHNPNRQNFRNDHDMANSLEDERSKRSIDLRTKLEEMRKHKERVPSNERNTDGWLKEQELRARLEHRLGYQTQSNYKPTSYHNQRGSRNEHDEDEESKGAISSHHHHRHNQHKSHKSLANEDKHKEEMSESKSTKTEEKNKLAKKMMTDAEVNEIFSEEDNSDEDVNRNLDTKNSNNEEKSEKSNNDSNDKSNNSSYSSQNEDDDGSNSNVSSNREIESKIKSKSKRKSDSNSRSPTSSRSTSQNEVDNTSDHDTAKESNNTGDENDRTYSENDSSISHGSDENKYKKKLSKEGAKRKKDRSIGSDENTEIGSESERSEDEYEKKLSKHHHKKIKREHSKNSKPSKEDRKEAESDIDTEPDEEVSERREGYLNRDEAEIEHKKEEKKQEPEVITYFCAIQGCRSVEEFECLNKIEEGAYGVVYRAKDKKTHELVALKRLKMEKEKEGFPITSIREVDTLLKAQHPNVVTVREIVVGSNMDKIYMVMDFVEHDLKSLMQYGMKKPFMMAEVKCLMLQLLSGIAHLHDNWIIHRDLKTSNLLLSHKGVLKIADFGLAREYGSPLKEYTPIVVTLWYRCPDLLLGVKKYSTAVDMWSVGCIFGELMLMKALFPGKNEKDQLDKIFKDLGTPTEKIWPGWTDLPLAKNLKFPDFPYNTLRSRFGTYLSDKGFELINKLLTYDPGRRIAADEALKHEFFKEKPLPLDSNIMQTWPAKSEGLNKNKAAKDSEPRAPSVGKMYEKLLGDDEGGFVLQFNTMSAGFTLR